MAQPEKKIHYEKAKECARCGSVMRYIYGEMFECPTCGYKEPTDFGKVREFLEVNGPQPAIVISENTGVTVECINELLREGRIEIPDGSEVFIKCQKCGTDIRYGRYCPDCMMKMTKSVSNALWMPEVGEKPKMKQVEGKMHYLDNRHKKTENIFKK